MSRLLRIPLLCKRDAHRDLTLVHYPLSVFFAVVRVALSLSGNLHVIEIQIQLPGVKVINASITDSSQNATQVWI